MDPLPADTVCQVIDLAPNGRFYRVALGERFGFAMGYLSVEVTVPLAPVTSAGDAAANGGVRPTAYGAPETSDVGESVAPASLIRVEEPPAREQRAAVGIASGVRRVVDDWFGALPHVVVEARPYGWGPLPYGAVCGAVAAVVGFVFAAVAATLILGAVIGSDLTAADAATASDLAGRVRWPLAGALLALAHRAPVALDVGATVAGQGGTVAVELRAAPLLFLFPVVVLTTLAGWWAARTAESAPAAGALAAGVVG
ncbi:MAG: hypothetical protein ACRDJN_15870, partial [Chloroflexota bacterium]